MKITVGRFINTECICIGLTFNWNWRPSVEVDFFFWRIEISTEKKIKKTEIDELFESFDIHWR